MRVTCALYFKDYSGRTPSDWSNACDDMQMYGKCPCNIYCDMHLSRVRTVIRLHCYILISFILTYVEATLLLTRVTFSSFVAGTESHPCVGHKLLDGSFLTFIKLV